MPPQRAFIDDETFALLERLAGEAARQAWTLYPLPDMDTGEPVEVAPADEPERTIATVAAMDDAEFIVAVRNHLPALVAEIRRLRKDR